MYFIDGQTIDYSGFIVYTSVIHQLKNVYFVFIICTIRLLSSAGVVFQYKTIKTNVLKSESTI